MRLRAAVALFVIAVGLVGPSAWAQQPVAVSLVPEIPLEGWAYTREASFPLWFHYPASCDEPVPAMQDIGTVVIRVNGRTVSVRQATTYDTTCMDGQRARKGYGGFPPSELPFGTYSMSIEFVGGERFASASVVVPFVIRPDIAVSYSGSSRLAAGTAVRYFGGQRCTSENMEFSSVRSPLAPPPVGRRFQYGFLNYRFENCRPDCDFGVPCDDEGRRSRKATLLEFPSDIPPDASLWVLNASESDSAQWQPLSATIDGRFAKVYLDGTLLKFDPDSQRYRALIRGSVGLSIPARPAMDKSFQDMWWGGPAEDGWGVAIAQQGDRLFVTLHVYDDSGQPAFYLLHNGSWDPARTTFSGALHRPNARTMGEPIGSLHLLFNDPDDAKLRYTLASGEGLKSIQRMPFGPATSQRDPHAGIWNLTLVGTGAMTISKRGDALFMTWLEFPGGGPGQWMVAPAGSWTSPDTFEATLYRTSGSRWAGADYDASRLNARAVGSVSVRFTGADDAEVTYTIDGVTRSSPLRRHVF